jgi:hypothetical protein
MLPILVKALQELKAEFDAYKASHPWKNYSIIAMILNKT